MVKHEALAVRRERERILAGPAAARPEPGREDWVALIPSESDGPPERAERREAIARSREALQALKPQELRALTLLAEGYSYAEIGEITGFSSDENQPLPGRGTGALPQPSRPQRGRAPLRRAGAARSPPSATARRAPARRPRCASTCAPARHCRATLRAYRAAPAAAAALAPALPLDRSPARPRPRGAGRPGGALRLGGGGSDSALGQWASAGGTRGRRAGGAGQGRWPSARAPSAVPPPASPPGSCRDRWRSGPTTRRRRRSNARRGAARKRPRPNRRRILRRRPPNPNRNRRSAGEAPGSAPEAPPGSSERRCRIRPGAAGASARRTGSERKPGLQRQRRRGVRAVSRPRRAAAATAIALLALLGSAAPGRGDGPGEPDGRLRIHHLHSTDGQGRWQPQPRFHLEWDQPDAEAQALIRADRLPGARMRAGKSSCPPSTSTGGATASDRSRSRRSPASTGPGSGSKANSPTVRPRR